MNIRGTDSNGTLRQFSDDSTRTYTEWDAAGVQTLTRPYTTEENARADVDAAFVVTTANKATIEQALSPALDELQTILDATNATINAGPAPFIKILARALRRVIRLVIRRFDGTA